jgi:crotonobetainyl-CoA:carnitine CoA-transferase CaiB-like acyl-CoA transferase
MDEVLEHPHMRARQTHMSGDRMQPTPAPRFHGKPTDAPAAQRYARPPTLEEALDCWPVSAAAHEALTAAAR